MCISFYFTNHGCMMHFSLRVRDPELIPKIHHPKLPSSVNQGRGPSLTLFWTCCYLSSADSSLRLMSPHPLRRPADDALQMCSLTLNNGSMWPLTYESTHLLDTLLQTCLSNLDRPCCTLGLCSVDLCSWWKQCWGTCATQTNPKWKEAHLWTLRGNMHSVTRSQHCIVPFCCIPSQCSTNTHTWSFLKHSNEVRKITFSVNNH